MSFDWTQHTRGELAAARERELRQERKLSELFAEFHRQSPQVYKLVVDLARQAKAAGHRKIGIGMLWEVMRWQLTVETNDQAGFKLNNSYRSRYARLVMQTEPDLAGVFETRVLKTN